MKNYNFSQLYKPPGDYLRIKTLSVAEQHWSPHIGGKLRFQPNVLVFTRTEQYFEPFIITQTIKKYGIKFKVRDTASVTWNIYRGDIPNLTGSEKQNLLDDSMNKALSRASSIQSNLADMYRTRQETANTVTRRVLQMANAANCLRRRNWRGACGALGINLKRPKSNINDFPSLWLEYNYGWAPLCNDIYHVLNRTFPEPYQRISASSKLERTSHGVKGAMSPTNFMLMWDASLKAKSKVSFTVFADGAAVAAISQYGLDNPAALAWEALPFSFVLDWILPIGNYLEMLTALHGLRLKDVTRTYTLDTVESGKYFVNYEDANQTWTSPGASYVSTVHNKDRQMPIPVYTFPRLKSPMGISHFTSAASLLAKAFKK